MVQVCKKHKSRTCKVCVGPTKSETLVALVRSLTKADCGHTVGKRDTRRYKGSVLCKDCHAFAK